MSFVEPRGRKALLFALAALAILMPAPAARADVGETIIQRCTHGQSLAGFKPSDYGRALKELSADAEEYTDCAALIRAAQLAAAGAGRGGAPAAGPAVALPTTPAERQSLARASHSGAAPQAVGGQIVRPGVVHVNLSSALSALPTPLLALLAFLLACLAAALGRVVRKRIRAHRPG